MQRQGKERSEGQRGYTYKGREAICRYPNLLLLHLVQRTDLIQLPLLTVTLARAFPALARFFSAHPTDPSFILSSFIIPAPV